MFPRAEGACLLPVSHEIPVIPFFQSPLKCLLPGGALLFTEPAASLSDPACAHLGTSGSGTPPDPAEARTHLLLQVSEAQCQRRCHGTAENILKRNLARRLLF